MIQLRLSAKDLERLRFAYSPLEELTLSLVMFATGRPQRPHRMWFDITRDRLRHLDLSLLRAVVPGTGMLPDFLAIGAVSPATTIEDQLSALAELSPHQLRKDLEDARSGEALTANLEEVLADSAGASRRIADALYDYWVIALEPHWPRMRAVLDGDVAYRAARVTSGGLERMMSDLHPELSLHGQALHIDKPRWSSDYELSGAGVLLVPSVFAWPYLVVDVGTHGSPSLTYTARGVGTLWESSASDYRDDDDALGDLLGRSRAAVLTGTILPISTTELAAGLGQSPPSVSAHLSVLRRNGLVTSWRSGRRVLYQRTPLAASLLAAGSRDDEATEYPA